MKPVKTEKPQPQLQQELLIKEPEKREEHVLTAIPPINIESEKENDKNAVNETKESVTQNQEETNHFIKRCDSKVIYSKFFQSKSCWKIHVSYFAKDLLSILNSTGF